MVCWPVCVSENQDSSIRTSPSSGEKHLDSTSSDLRAGSERERASEQERERECMYACVSLCMCVCTAMSVCGVCVHARMSVSLSEYDRTRPPLPHPITGRRQTTDQSQRPLVHGSDPTRLFVVTSRALTTLSSLEPL